MPVYRSVHRHVSQDSWGATCMHWAASGPNREGQMFCDSMLWLSVP